MDVRRQGFAWCAAAVIFLSAFLLFQVQPLISKAILPWFGGSPAVWTTAMLFFQVVLLAGYAYAHLLTRLQSRRWQLVVHLLLLAAAAAMLPITPSPSLKPDGGEQPALRILILLTVSVGLPYFLLASTGPLVQAWFARVYEQASPYRLYALSNVGSMLALLTYPFVVEPALTVAMQGLAWSAGFGVFAASCALLAWWAARFRAPAPPATTKPAMEDVASHRPRYIICAALAALAVVVLLSVTNQLCRDVAVVPFLWIVPLALYLLSFIICFDHERWYSRGVWGGLTAVLSLLVCAAVVASLINQLVSSWDEPFNKLGVWLSNVYVQSTLFLAWLFGACMVCHGELYRQKPAARYVTSYYLCISAGGALGGLFVAFLCPLIFSTYWEWNLSIVAVYLLSAGIGGHHAWHHWLARSRMLRASLALCIAGGTLLCVRAQVEAQDPQVLARIRNFYGVLSVKPRTYAEFPSYNGIALYHGRILHGYQFKDPSKRRLGATYYGPNSGSGIIMERLHALRDSVRVGVIGLGAGTMAALVNEGDHLCFYEIDKDVVDLQEKFFTYIKDSKADVDIVLGDARVRMEAMPPQKYDALFMDAFSGDAIPTHLVTAEAIDIYRRHLKDDGLIVIHISNRYVNLVPVVKGLSQYAKMDMLRFRNPNPGNIQESASDWVVLTNDWIFLNDEQARAKGEQISMKVEPILWTDQFSNLFDVLMKP